MTDERLPLIELLQKAGDGDFLRSVAEAVLQLLMEADVEGVIGAARHERTAERQTYRNGFRDRTLDTRLGTLLVVAVARLLQLATAEALAENGPLVFGDGALDLQQELVIRVVRDRVLQEHDLNACAADLFQEQDLVGVFAGEAIGGQHGDDSDATVAHGVPECVEAGPVEPAAAVALVAEDEVVADLVPSRSRPVAQSGELAV